MRSKKKNNWNPGHKRLDVTRRHWKTYLNTSKTMLKCHVNSLDRRLDGKSPYVFWVRKQERIQELKRPNHLIQNNYLMISIKMFRKELLLWEVHVWQIMRVRLLFKCDYYQFKRKSFRFKQTVLVFFECFPISGLSNFFVYKIGLNEYF